MKKIIFTEEAPAAIGPYSQAIEVNGMVYTSGQLPIDYKTGLMSDDVEVQTEQSLKNVFAILKAAGVDPENVIKTTVFIKDMNDFPRINKVYETFFQGNYPARSCVEVARLPKDALVEIEVVACK
ncbi:2-iminobutanoate/2-iminopropanoate deaminase [bioreactor metagenome]|jgi:2-iminobutanoate/2-iminopropanoate deaminase|uniref:2-iminobutanoate/2-iminopropanoate deaminase n=2 Tax=root TaxID=1 RepID=A0A562JBF5_9FIRM|nr:RidA family protein [Sedimentibacter saalensis]MEA5093941.1 RidA family protein [Sedimentibacter saalensis]TWH80558.1 2-iminobutanoate/2-iminopropanoate deaminase [Sedimentibacter saalensis]